MAIRRWEMLLSAQADSYLLKIQGDRTDVDRIIQAHAAVCQNVQEISEDTFQWAIFVVGATLAEKLAIQNQVMSLTTDAEGKKPSDSLLDVIEGLSGALQDLTNLTDDEQAYVMNKMARMGQAAAPAPLTGAPAGGGVLPPPQAVPRSPAAPGAVPGRPVPGPIPSGPGQPLPPVPGFSPGRVAPQPIPGRVSPGTPLPPVSIPGGLPVSPASPGIVRPAQPPKSFGPAVPQTPLPPVSLPKVSFPGLPGSPKPPPPPPPPTAPVEPPRPPVPPPPPAAEEPKPLPPVKPPSVPPPVAPQLVPPATQEIIIEKRADPLPPRVEPLAATPPKPAPPAEPAPVAAEVGIESSPLKKIPTAPVAPPATVPLPKQDDGHIQSAIFYPVEGEEWKNQFLNTLSDIALKKSKKPTHFKLTASVAGPISLDHSAEWIWKSKTSGADILFIVIPPEMGSDLMEPVVAEAESAGLRCFLVPQTEINSKLLYMDLMVELMMFKKRIRAPAP
jgi:hypothetical protein